MNSAKDSAVAVKTMTWGSPPIPRNTRRFLELHSQFLRFGKMLKLTRIGKLTNGSQCWAEKLQSGIWNTWLLWRKYPIPDPNLRRGDQGRRASIFSWHQ